MDERTLRQSLAAVAEFKGLAWNQGNVVGVVRFVQLDGATTRVEGVLEGLLPGKHTLSVHSYGVPSCVLCLLSLTALQAT